MHQPQIPAMTTFRRFSRIALLAASLMLSCFISVETGGDNALDFANACPQAAVLGITVNDI